MVQCSLRKFSTIALLALIIFVCICYRFHSSNPKFEPNNNRQVVVYNRIPKTGSTSVVRIFESLVPMNNFHIIRVNISNHIQFSNPIFHKSLIDKVQQLILSNRPLFVHGHFAHISFNNYGSSIAPIFINIVRDPLERLVSKYYFIRFGDDHRPHVYRSRMTNNTERWQTFDECVETRGRDCNPVLIWAQIPQFCGYAWFCNDPGNRIALDTAKRHLVEEYLLVGTLEKLEDFMQILSQLLPSFLSGLETTRDKTSKGKSIWHMRSTQKKSLLHQKTVDFFHSNLLWQMEQEFFEFASREFLSRLQFFRNAGTKNPDDLFVQS